MPKLNSNFKEFFESEYIDFALKNGWDGNLSLLRFNDELPNVTRKGVAWRGTDVSMHEILEASNGVVSRNLEDALRWKESVLDGFPNNTVVFSSERQDGISYLMLGDIIEW